MSDQLDGTPIDDDLNYLMYPKVFTDYTAVKLMDLCGLAHQNILYGMEPGEEITAEIDPGKTLKSVYKQLGKPPMMVR